IQFGAISSFIVSQNSYASRDLALPLGIWHFACKSHVDVQCVYCHFGSIVSDSTVCNTLNSMTEASLAALQESVGDATEQGESEWGKILDNVQQYSPVYKHGLGQENQLKVGTVCMAFHYEDCKPGAFDANNHIARVVKQECQTMTTKNVYASIDWSHNRNEISARFRNAPIAKHHMRAGRKTLVQPLGTNTEREVETQGMGRAILNFDQQMGAEPEKSHNILSWVPCDGVSHATIMCLKKYLSVTPDIYKYFRNVISTLESWHTKTTDLNSCVSNHYDPAASKDLSSLSCSSNAANMKRPTDLKKCDFYPTSHHMTMIWEARVLDCWRLVLGVDLDILAHSDELAAHNILPSLDDLLDQANESGPRNVDEGPPRDTEANMPGLVDIPDDSAVGEAEPPDVDGDTPAPENPLPAKSKSNDKEDGPKIHNEAPGYNGNRVISNAILFIMEFGWWIELNYAIPEGDIGRVLEILKVCNILTMRSSMES
ncbi:hypothetical protein B0H10DRAFT_1833009, partial [Mycena sp. CBHHK59/15]